MEKQIWKQNTNEFILSISQDLSQFIRGQTLAVITLVTIPVIIIYALLLDGAQSVLADDNKMQITEELAEKLRAHGDKLILGICVCTTPDAFL